MAYVPQDAYLFAGTIAENIRYGRPDVSEDEIVAVAKAANAHEFIVAQPDGYQTMVGERGARLSGGQRQRIAIARALLKDAPILLLDEATSALDSESEQWVQEALNVLMEGRTTIAVAHRLSTIEKADTIYVIDGGRMVECGRHDELLARGGLYASLYELQFEHDGEVVGTVLAQGEHRRRAMYERTDRKGGDRSRDFRRTRVRAS
jgi:ABC-type multidrug transport system fused ATPase/permease subunit